MRCLLFFTLCLGSLFHGNSQTCCSANTPFTGTLDLLPGYGENGYLILQFDYNNIHDYINGTSSIRTSTNQRISQSVIFEMGYNFTSRLGFSLLGSWIHKWRLSQTGASQNLYRNQSVGLGDALFLIRYSLQPFTILHRTFLAVGLGIKFPTGKISATENGIRLPEDMQPGTGSWDVLAIFAYAIKKFPVPQMDLIFRTSFRVNSSNKYRYHFGNEWFNRVGGIFYLTDTFWLSSTVLLRYSTPDKRNSTTIPNTGGVWVYIQPGIYISFSQRTLLRAGLYWPLYRKLNGTQLTTSYRLEGNITFNF